MTLQGQREEEELTSSSAAAKERAAEEGGPLSLAACRLLFADWLELRPMSAKRTRTPCFVSKAGTHVAGTKKERRREEGMSWLVKKRKRLVTFDEERVDEIEHVAHVRNVHRRRTRTRRRRTRGVRGEEVEERLDFVLENSVSQQRAQKGEQVRADGANQTTVGRRRVLIGR